MKNRYIVFLFALMALIIPTYAAEAIDFDPTSTFIKTDSESVTADGIDQAIVTVRVRNVNRVSVGGVSVKLISSRGNMDQITPEIGTSNSFGEAKFYVRSLKNGTSNFSALLAEDYPSTNSVTITFENGFNLPLPAGSLIKIPSDSDPNTYSDTAVYYFASDGRRYVFPNEKVYFTWYPTFENVNILSLEDMTKIPIGGNVTYRPGSKLVKFQTDNKVYAVYQNGELRWVPTEQLAKDLYGDGWAAKVDDINESFYVNYTFGMPIEHRLDFVPDTIYNKFSTIEKDKSI
ncbi:MAG: Ig-like domain-containing protein [Patescibacteria group bacterium]|nr:Ig-like domain-containing protein [Patescibacteria group bacterium]